MSYFEMACKSTERRPVSVTSLVLVHNGCQIKCRISLMFSNFLFIYQMPVVIHFGYLSTPRVSILSYCSQVYMLRLKGFNVCFLFWLLQQKSLTTLIGVCGTTRVTREEREIDNSCACLIRALNDV